MFWIWNDNRFKFIRLGIFHGITLKRICGFLSAQGIQIYSLHAESLDVFFLILSYSQSNTFLYDFCSYLVMFIPGMTGVVGWMDRWVDVLYLS